MASEAIDASGLPKLLRAPALFNHEPVQTARAPQAAEHTETFLMALGLDCNRIEKLKAAGVTA